MGLNQALQELNEAFTETDSRMPALFIGHGSPMNAIEENDFSKTWVEVGRTLPRPTAILCISAHWETIGTQVTAMEHPRTIHDFGGFPTALYEMEYPAPGSLELAHLTQEVLTKVSVRLERSWGLDHGAWSVLSRMYPEADIPVIQLSLDRTQTPAFHYALAKQLAGLRRRGVLLLGSGNMVHNLRMAVVQDGAFDWAIEFDERLRDLILQGNHQAIVNYPALGPSARLAVPTNEHYLPLLYVLGVKAPDEPLHFFADQVTLGSISMRSVWVGA